MFFKRKLPPIQSVQRTPAVQERLRPSFDEPYQQLVGLLPESKIMRLEDNLESFPIISDSRRIGHDATADLLIQGYCQNLRKKLATLDQTERQNFDIVNHLKNWGLSAHKTTTYKLSHKTPEEDYIRYKRSIDEYLSLYSKLARSGDYETVHFLLGQAEKRIKEKEQQHKKYKRKEKERLLREKRRPTMGRLLSQ